MRDVARNILNWGVVCIGFLQMSGWIFNFDQLETIGLLSGASPLPLVFNKVEGLEYWASKFHLQFKMNDGSIHRVQMTRDLFSKLEGPHVLHLAYALPVALSPVTPPEFWKPPLSYGFCFPGKLTKLFGFEKKIHSLFFEVISRTVGKERKWNYTVDCPS
jgi:hypothetical protein